MPVNLPPGETSSRLAGMESPPGGFINRPSHALSGFIIPGRRDPVKRSTMELLAANTVAKNALTKRTSGASVH